MITWHPSLEFLGSLRGAKAVPEFLVLLQLDWCWALVFSPNPFFFVSIFTHHHLFFASEQPDHSDQCITFLRIRSLSWDLVKGMKSFAILVRLVSCVQSSRCLRSSYSITDSGNWNCKFLLFWFVKSEECQNVSPVRESWGNLMRRRGQGGDERGRPARRGGGGGRKVQPGGEVQECVLLMKVEEIWFY